MGILKNAHGVQLFSSQYWYIGVLTAVAVSSEVFAAMYLRHRKWLTRVVLWCLATYMLVAQAMALNASKTFNWAFSTIAFWLFIVGVIVPWRPLKSISAAFCFISGCVYTAGFLIYPPMMSHMGEFGIAYMSSFLLHDVLIFGSLLMYTQFQVKKYDVAAIGVAIAVIVLITELGAHVWQWNNINTFLLGMVEGSALVELFPDLPLTWWWYILWYIVVLSALWGIWEVIRLLNKKLFIRKGETKGDFVW